MLTYRWRRANLFGQEPAQTAAQGWRLEDRSFHTAGPECSRGTSLRWTPAPSWRTESDGLTAPDRQLALEKYRRCAATYDRWSKLTATRRRAIERLGLQPGDVVLDVGCGTGLSFALVEERIGTAGRLIGIDQSPEMLATARERIATGAWGNVTLIDSSVGEAIIPAVADAVLFHFTHDIMRSPRALENVMRHAKQGARVVAAGMKWAPWWAVPVNLVAWRVARRAITTFEGFARPWSHLEHFAPDLHTEAMWLGAAYIAWGTVAKT